MQLRRILFAGLLLWYSHGFTAAENRPVSNTVIKDIHHSLALNNASLHEVSIPDTLKTFYFDGDFFSITANNQVKGYLYSGRVKTCRNGGCHITGTEGAGYEYFDYYILFSKKPDVLKVKVLNYQATHGYEICNKQWLKQFKGFGGKEALRTGKNIDAISGATISANAIVFDVQKVFYMLKYMIETNSSPRTATNAK